MILISSDGVKGVAYNLGLWLSGRPVSPLFLLALLPTGSFAGAAIAICVIDV